MRDFNKGGSRGGGRGFGGGGRGFGGGGRRGGGDREMFDAVCANCGNNCKVPFMPSGNKPVYCSDCFEKENDGGNRRSFDRNDRPQRGGFGGGFDRPQRSSETNYQPQLDMINKKLDLILDTLKLMGEE